jgi:molybdopterin/thiamine biosynthesis adenylyltransferase
MSQLQADGKSNHPNPEQFNRNLGFISQKDHECLQKSVVAIAGAGGDGGELAVTLAQLGVGHFRIADPEVFEIDNLNRQTGASYKTLGQNKAMVIAHIIKDINPFADVQVFTQGITPDNVNGFVAGSNLVIDETEYTQHELGVMLARAARKHNLPVLMAMNIGFGSYTTSFSPAGQTFEAYLGLDPTASLEDIARATVPLSKWVPHIPSYADMNIFQKVANQEVSTPTVSPGVKMAAAEASMQALAHLLRESSPQRARWIHYAPRGKSIDVIDGATMVRFRRIHFAKSVAIAMVRTKLGKNPPAGY